VADAGPATVQPGPPATVVELTSEPFDATAAAAIVSPADGALSTFVGVVRDNQDGRAVRHLEYEAHEAMALRQMLHLAEEARQRFGVGGVLLRHRLGRLEIGEVSVVVAVAAAHRAEAIEACHWLIDTLKAEVPIFKKEFFRDGEGWVE
jgi:molybdopterin synthase catalytic subunit